jgi:hypothetical protein
MHRQRVSGEQKRKKKEEGVYQSKGASQSEARGKAHPRARQGGRHISEQCGGEGASQSVVQKGGGGVVSQKKGNGEARDDLESFIADCPCVGTSPKGPRHVTYL